MRKLIQVGLVLAAMTVLFSSCNQYKKMQKNVGTIEASANPEVLTLVGNSTSADVTVTFPPKYFEKNMIIKLTPVLIFDGGEVAGEPRYYQGEKVKANYTVVPKKEGGTYTYRVTIPYNQRADLSTLEMRVEGRYEENKKAELAQFSTFGMLPMGNGISTLQKLTVPYMSIMPDNFKRIITVTEEAEIRYQINSSNVTNAQLSQEQIKLFEEFVKENEGKDNVTMGNIYAKGYASPEGPEKFNDKLSASRSQSGEKALRNQLKDVNVNYDAAAYGEDWEGFRKLVEASTIADKDLILQVLAMYDNSAKRDEEIKNLSQVYTELKESVLPQLRRTQFVVSADVEGLSDAELIAAANRGDRNLNVEEMLYAATLVDGSKKADVYRMAANTYNDARAYNNLAVELVKAGDAAGAKTAIDRAARLESSPVITNNLAAVAIAQGDVATAKQYLSALNTPDAKRNKGIIAVYEGDYAAAARDLDGYNLALAETMNGNYAKAKSALGSANCGDAEYLRAVIAVREGDSKGAIAYLKSAISKKPELKNKAKKDVEFARLFTNSDFMAL